MNQTHLLGLALYSHSFCSLRLPLSLLPTLVNHLGPSINLIKPTFTASVYMYLFTAATKLVFQLKQDLNTLVWPSWAPPQAWPPSLSTIIGCWTHHTPPPPSLFSLHWNPRLGVLAPSSILCVSTKWYHTVLDWYRLWSCPVKNGIRAALFASCLRIQIACTASPV